MGIIKKTVLIIFSFFYINSLFFQSFANDSHHFLNITNVESSCSAEDGCCDSTTDECITKCIPGYEIATSSYKSVTKYCHIPQINNILLITKRASFNYNTNLHYNKSYIDRNLFISSYIGKQKIT